MTSPRGPQSPPIVYITWLDAATSEAAEPHHPVDTALARLHTAGFLIGETDTTVTVGLEVCGEDVVPGRYRITIPKSSIVELYTFPVTGLRKKAQRAR